jgi:ParB family chromosome partitioning protein
MTNGSKRRQLGRGLSSLLGSEADTSDPGVGKQTQSILISKIRPGTEQPRRIFSDVELKSLADSIKERGILQPLLLRNIPGDLEQYEIIAGERRWRAAQLAQLHEVPALVRDFNNQEALEIGLIENIQRSDLRPLEEAAAFQRLIDEYGHTQELVAEAVGKSRSYIANSLRLLVLPLRVREHLDAGRLTVGHARALLTSPEAEKLSDYVVSGGLSVRATEKLAQEQLKPVKISKNLINRLKVSRATTTDPDIAALQRDIIEKLGLKVEIKTTNGENGLFVIHYRSLEQFDHLFEKLTS